MTPQSRMTSTTTTTTTTENINILIANSGLSAPILVETRQLGLWINGTAAVQLCDCQVTSIEADTKFREMFTIFGFGEGPYLGFP